MKNNFYEDEFNTGYFLNTLIRNKILISSFTFLSIVISIFYFFFAKKIWEGQFQIVLSTNNAKSLIPSQISGAAFLNAQAANKLKTEVGILESPSVLMPIFDFVKSEKKKSSKNYDELVFYDWKENLKIKLKKNTSILDISYQDTNKDLILPVLEKMSKAFQVYSGKNKLRNLKITKDYLNNQIFVYKQKSESSIKKAQEFAMAQDLLISDDKASFANKNIFSNQSEGFEIPSYLLSNTSIESMRVRAANQIRNLNEQLKNIDKLDDNDDELQYLASTIPALNSEGLPRMLKNIQEQIINERVKYTDNDKRLKILFERKELYINLLKKRAIGYLKAQILATEAYMKSAIRPEGIVLKYKELMREAERDENTLIKLENQLRALKLSEAKIEDPWELITTPTLLDFPTSPKLKILIFYGLIFGLFSGVSFAIYKENKSDLIFEEEELKKHFNNSNLLKINLLNFDSEKISNEILKGFLVKTNKIFFIKTNNITEGDLNSLSNYIGDINNQKNKSYDFDIVNIYDEKLKDSNVNFLLIKMPNISKKEIKEITNFLNFSNIKINNLLLL